MNEVIETRKPPVATTGILGWLRMNLFSNWINSLISLFVLYILIQFVPWILNWTIFAADFKYNFNGEEIINREMCSRVLDPVISFILFLFKLYTAIINIHKHRYC